MNKLKQAARQALEALEYETNSHESYNRKPLVSSLDAIAALREALAEPQITTPDVCGEVCARAKLCYGCNKDLEESNAKYAEQAEQSQLADATLEPVAWMGTDTNNNPNKFRLNPFSNCVPLYAAPVRTKDLTDDEIDAVLWIGGLTEKNIRKFARAVIAADREKNNANNNT